jgi:hypothetical protein
MERITIDVSAVGHHWEARYHAVDALAGAEIERAGVSVAPFADARL